MFAGRELDLVFIAVLAVITVIVVSVLYSGKKSTAKLEQILLRIPETDKCRLRASSFYEYGPNANFLIGTSYIYNVVPNTERMEVQLLYFQPIKKEFVLDAVHMSTEDFQKKNLQVGSCVTTLHNRAGEVAFKIKEIL